MNDFEYPLVVQFRRIQRVTLLHSSSGCIADAARARLGGSELVADHPCACFTTTVSVEGDVALTNPQITSSPVTKPTGTPWVAA